MKKAYSTLILSKLNYAGLLYDTAAKSLLLLLDRVQFAAARILLGALKCTPVSYLEAEANLLPLSLHRKQSLTKYASRILAIEGHPLRANMMNFYPYEYYKYLKESLPIVGRVYYEFCNAKISFSDAVSFPLWNRLFFPSGQISCNATLHKYKKSNVDNTQWKILFKDMMDNFKDYISVYCDGSVHGGRIGCGVYSNNFKLKARLSDSSSILIAELTAIYYALLYVTKFPSKYIILSASLSAISVINIGSESKHSHAG